MLALQSRVHLVFQSNCLFLACSQKANCATCIVSNNFCTSCTTGYVLNGNKCISEIYLKFFVKLDTSPMSFYSLTNSFKAFIPENTKAKTSIEGVTITSIKNGSTDIEGGINAEDAEELETMKTSLDKALADSKFEKFTILSS